jgi:hypothetical protein
MKSLKLPMLLFLVIVTTTAVAQNLSMGLYLTYNDFVKHHISYSESANKITLHRFFEEQDVTVTVNGQKQNIAKSKLFGYRESGKDYRFYKNKAYKIVDTAEFYIYKSDAPNQIAKYKTLTINDFFSIRGNTPVMPLTIQNVTAAFAADRKFKYLVRSEFKADNELEIFDPIEKQYKIKEVFTDSKK